MPRTKQAKPAPPRLPRFSPTRIELYLFCPRAYFYYYVRGLRWGGARAGQTLGGNLHRALQVFHNQGGAERVSLDDLVTTLRERWSHAGFATEEEAARHLAAGEAVLHQYYHTAPEPGRETLWTEKTVQQRYEEFVLFGKVDRLDRRPDGALEVMDYKSGRLTVSEEEVRGSLAMRIYALLVARNHPGETVYTGIHCLRSGVCASVPRPPEELDEVEREVAEIIRRILADERMAPIPGPECRDCPYPRICPAGRKWLWENPEV